jgi:hypothetical protein
MKFPKRQAMLCACGSILVLASGEVFPHHREVHQRQVRVWIATEQCQAIKEHTHQEYRAFVNMNLPNAVTMITTSTSTGSAS